MCVWRCLLHNTVIGRLFSNTRSFEVCELKFEREFWIGPHPRGRVIKNPWENTTTHPHVFSHVNPSISTMLWGSKPHAAQWSGECFRFRHFCLDEQIPGIKSVAKIKGGSPWQNCLQNSVKCWSSHMEMSKPTLCAMLVPQKEEQTIPKHKMIKHGSKSSL